MAMSQAGEQTGRRIRRAAVRMFATKGFHGTGIRDLAASAGLSPASLYHHVGGKEELLAELMTEALTRLIDGARRVVDGVEEPDGRIARLAVLHVLTHAVQPNQTKVVDNEVRSLTPAMRRPVVRLRDEYERLWAEAIDAGLAAGMFHTAEPPVSRKALLDMCGGVSRWYSPKGPLTLDQLGGHYALLTLRALGYPGDRLFDDCIADAKAVVTAVWGVRM